MLKLLKTHRIAAAAAAAALLLGGCAPSTPKKDRAIAVEQPWVRLPAVAGEPGAGYFRLTGGAEGTTLVGVSSPLVKRIELHESMTGGAMASMKKLDDVDFAYDGTIVFKPGGRHAMLFGIAAGLKPGATLPLTFAFDNAPPITVSAQVRSPAGDTGGEHAGQ
jgi:copper(I)-binding protein